MLLTRAADAILARFASFYGLQSPSGLSRRVPRLSHPMRVSGASYVQLNHWRLVTILASVVNPLSDLRLLSFGQVLHPWFVLHQSRPFQQRDYARPSGLRRRGRNVPWRPKSSSASCAANLAPWGAARPRGAPRPVGAWSADHQASWLGLRPRGLPLGAASPSRSDAQRLLPHAAARLLAHTPPRAPPAAARRRAHPSPS